MSSNLLNELKRRLEDERTPLPKRLCLAKNVVKSHHFSAAPKERIVAEWLERLNQKNRLSSEDLQKILLWLESENDFTSELKTKLIEIVTQFIKKNPLETNEMKCLISFIENEKMITTLGLHIDEYLLIPVTILQNLRLKENINTVLVEQIFKNIEKYFRNSKKKLEFTKKIIDKENLETIFSYLDTECYDSVINLCKNTLFQNNKKSFFASFLLTLVRKDNIDSLKAEKGDNIQTVLKVMSVFFTFPNGRTEKNESFLQNFIEVFISCFKTESQLVFAFCIMVANSLTMVQSYMTPNMNMPPIIFEENDEKIKRNLFLRLLEVLLKYEVDINVRLTDTYGEKVSKVEIKKTFTSFLQAVMMGQLKLEGKPDKATLQIIQLALKLDPMLIEQKIVQILPPLMTAKKNGSSVIESYTETLNCLIEVLFKLSRGTVFINKILPHLKVILEASNTEQFALLQKLKECEGDSVASEKISKQIITGNDLFPEQSVDLFSRLTSELMSRQNTELLQSLHKDFEEHCLMMLEEGFVSPSIITLTEVLSAILSTHFQYNKMADHSVPRQIAEDFWTSFSNFEQQCLKKFGECILKLNYNSALSLSFLKLGLGVARLKLINLKYGFIKLELPCVKNSLEVFDLSSILPCLDTTQWIEICTKVTDDEGILVLNQLLQAKIMGLQILHANNAEAMDSVALTKAHLIKQLPIRPQVADSELLLTDLVKAHLKQVAKSLVKMYSNAEEEFQIPETISNNRPLLNAILTETLRNILKCLDNSETLSKAIGKSDFDMSNFTKDLDVKEFFNSLILNTENGSEELIKHINILKQLKIYYLDENYILATIFILLAVKRNCKKKIKRNIDNVLQRIFEVSSKTPDLYKVFSVEFLFSSNEENLVELLTLKNKTSNHTLLIKSIMESGVKKVKSDSEIVKKIVEILLSKKPKKTSGKEFFTEPHFQLCCIILPIIAKEKRAITTSAYRSILANLQEKLHSKMLKAFKNIDFSNNSSLLVTDSGNPDESLASENNLAILNAMEAFSLSLSKYCETTVPEEMQNLDYLWSGLEFFIQNAIQTIQKAESKNHHVDSSVQLLNVTLRNIKKLESHELFKSKDKILLEIWRALKTRLFMVFDSKQDRKRVSDSYFEDIAVTLKFVCELSSLECFVSSFLGDLTNLVILKKPNIIVRREDSTNSHLTSHKVSKYLWISCLKANIVGPKCVAMSKVMYRTCRNLLFWIRLQYDSEDQDGAAIKTVKIDSEHDHGTDTIVKIIKVDDSIVELLKMQLITLSEVILAAKKISLDYKFLDAIFELQHLIQYILGLNPNTVTCELSWDSYFSLYEGSLSILNNLLLSREELLEDRWPCYMQCYRALITSLCEKSTTQIPLEKHNEEKLAEIAHCVEKLTQSMCRRKTHISRLAAYTVADICHWLEKSGPSRMVRQHLENSVSLLIQASDSTYAMAFLRRALAGSSGQMTMTNLYSMYKRYHKYTGNA